MRTILFIILIAAPILSFSTEGVIRAEKVITNNDGTTTLVAPYQLLRGKKYSFIASSSFTECLPAYGELYGLDQGICSLNGFTLAVKYSRRKPMSSDQSTARMPGRFFGVDVNSQGMVRGVCAANLFIKTITCR